MTTSDATEFLDPPFRSPTYPIQFLSVVGLEFRMYAATAAIQPIRPSHICYLEAQIPDARKGDHPG